MKKIRIGINGFGRIGRIAARIILNRPNLELVAINSRADASSHAYLLKYDSTYGTIGNKIATEGNFIIVDKQKISVFNNDTPAEIPWEKVKVDIVIDATGKFRKSEDLKGHLQRKVKYVTFSAPAKDTTKTIILGFNQATFNPKSDFIVSNSSCTTNCLVTTLKVLHERFSVLGGFMTTVHSVTDTQNLMDNSSKEGIRDRRSAFASMIPVATGSSKEVNKFFPDLNGKIFCQAIRIPLYTVSIINLIVQTKNKLTVEEVNNAFVKASKTHLKGVLDVATEELVSKDYTANPHSAIIDPYLTQVTGGNLVNVYAWYDNEWGYTSRLVDMVEYIGNKANLI